MEPKPRLLTILDAITLALFIITLGMVFFYAPLEAVMGQVQKVFYFHVATAWVGMLGFTFAFYASLLVLMRGKYNLGFLRILLALAVVLSLIASLIFHRLYLVIPAPVFIVFLIFGVRLKLSPRDWDILSLAAIEISLVFFFVAIVLGSIWARPIWGKWWTWEPRLTTAAIVELVYAAYLLLRQGIEDPDRRARFGAVYTILGFISVPMTFLSIRIVRAVHPVVIGDSNPSATGSFDMTPRMLQTFLFNMLTFLFVFIDLFWHRIRLGKLAEKIEQLRLMRLQ